jgi:hypothetical protein
MLCVLTLPVETSNICLACACSLRWLCASVRTAVCVCADVDCVVGACRGAGAYLYVCELLAAELLLHSALVEDEDPA